MYQVVFTKRFKKDMKHSIRQGKDINQFKLIVKYLVSGKKLDAIFKDHQLIGNYVGRRECHIESDWLLIYKIENNLLICERIGSHSQLFSN